MKWILIFFVALLFSGCVHRRETRVQDPSHNIALLEQPFQEHVDLRLVAFRDRGFSPVSFFDLNGNLVTITLPDSNLEEWRKLRDGYESYASVPAEKKEQLLRKRVRPFPEDLKPAVYAVWKDGLTQLGDEDLSMKHLPPFGNRFWLRTPEGNILAAEYYDPDEGTVGKELYHVAWVLSKYATYEISEPDLRWALWRYKQATLNREQEPLAFEIIKPVGEIPEHFSGGTIFRVLGSIYLGDVSFYERPLHEVSGILTQQSDKDLPPGSKLTISCSEELARLPVSYIGKEMKLMDVVLDIADQVGADLEFDGLEIKFVPRSP